MFIVINEKAVEINKDGFLNDLDQWEPAVASAMADIDGVVLTELHWEVIMSLRDYYEKYRIVPDLQIMSKVIGCSLGVDKGSKEYLTALFFGSPAKIVCKYAGFPKPFSCACV